LALIPPLLWNIQHDWITMGHLCRPRFQLPVFLVLHFGVYSPLLFGGMLWALWRGCREAWGDFRCRFLALFALPLLVMYGALSLKQCGEAYGTAPAFVSLGILAVAFWHEFAHRSVAARRFALAALGLGMVMSLVSLNTDAVRRLGVRWPYKQDPSGQLRGWETAAIAVEDLRHKMEQETGKSLFLIADKYQTAASLAFYLPEKRTDGPGHPAVYFPESQAIENQYSFWGRYDEMVDPPELARAMLPKVMDTAKREGLAAALQELDAAGSAKLDAEKMAVRRQALIRAMLAVDPLLPLDEYASEDWGISLFQGRDALYIADRPGRLPAAIKQGFEKVELVATWQEERLGLPLRLIWVFACHNYRSLPL